LYFFNSSLFDNAKLRAGTVSIGPWLYICSRGVFSPQAGLGWPKRVNGPGTKADTVFTVNL
jgi:hypothetical protein